VFHNGGSEWQNDSPSDTYNLPDYYETPKPRASMQRGAVRRRTRAPLTGSLFCRSAAFLDTAINH